MSRECCPQHNDLNRAAVSRQSKRRDRDQPALAKRLDNSVSLSNRVIASVVSSTESPLTRIPVSPSTTASGTPPERPPTTARRQAPASRKTRPKPSSSPSGIRRLGCTNKSQVL